MADWSLRLARIEDAEAFHRVEEDASSLLREEPSLKGIAIPPSSSASEHRSMIRSGHCLCAVSSEEVIGFAASRPYGKELHLHELSVSTKFQGRRIGATLLKALQVDANNSGFRAITLNTFRDIPWNAPFYERHGFVTIEDLQSHPRLAKSHADAVAAGLPAERRCAMICFLS